MPCDSSYLEATTKEVEFKRAATLLAFLYQETHQECPGWVTKEAGNYYAGDERIIPELCSFIRAMDPETFDRIAYNTKNRIARDLANWWEDHLEADKQREENESLFLKRDALIESAKRKLTEEERKAVGL